MNPQDKAKALEPLLLWDRHIDTMDNTTDAICLAAVEDPSGIQSERFEGNRLAAVETVARLLEETKDQGHCVKLEDEKGSNLMLISRSGFHLFQRLMSVRTIGGTSLSQTGSCRRASTGRACGT